MNVPGDLKYVASHEWVLAKDTEATIGITDFAQSELGDVVFVEMPEVGQVLQKEEQFGTVESVKTVSELYSPLAGEVTAVNEELMGHPELVNKDPYGAGWILRLRLADPAEVDGLLDAAGYQKVVEEA